MIPASIAAAIVIINLVITVVIGVGVGFALSRVLRRPWGASDAGIDGVLAAVVAICGALIVNAIDAAQGNTQSRVMLVAVIAVGSVALRHVLRHLLSNGRTGG